MIRVLLVVGLVCLSGCKFLGANQGAVVQLGVDLATLAASNNRTAAQLVDAGQTFCKLTDGGKVVALLGSSALGQTSDAVALACSAISAVPVAPPAIPGAVPVVKPG